MQAEPVDHRGRSAAGRRHHGDPRFVLQLRRAFPCKERSDLDQRFEKVDPQDAAVAEESVERAVGAGERAGVRAREALAELRAAELVGDYRLARRMRRARARGKARRIAHRLQEQQDAARLRVGGEQFDQFAHPQIRFIANRD